MLDGSSGLSVTKGNGEAGPYLIPLLFCLGFHIKWQHYCNFLFLQQLQAAAFCFEK